MNMGSVSNSAIQQFTFFADLATLILLRKFCQHISSAIFLVSELFCRRQQHANHGGISSFMLGRHGTEMISPPAGVLFFLHLQLSTWYCRTFQAKDRPFAGVVQ
jgi:hypothetical protein